MSFERLAMPIDRRVLDALRHGALWSTIVAFVHAFRQRFENWLAADAETDSIAWEDGEVDDDGVRR